MNLRNQLSLAFGAVLLAVLGIIAVFDAQQSRRYLDEQLTRNAQDAATSLALSMQAGWLDAPDVPMLRSLGDALFDRGLYRSLVLTQSDGVVLVSRLDTRPVATVPMWFQQLLPLTPRPGLAEVSDGWRTMARLEIAPHPGLAYMNLWQRLQRALLSVVLGALVATGLVYVFMARLFRPLDRIRAETEHWALGSFAPLPRPNIPEVAPLVDSLNRSNAALARLFDGLEHDLDAARLAANTDAVSGALNRDTFCQRLDSALADDDLVGGSVMLRFADLKALNENVGRATADSLIQAAVAGLESVLGEGAMVARLNGSDLIGFTAGGDRDDLAKACRALDAALAPVIPPATEREGLYKTVATPVTPKDGRGDVLSRLDRALTEAPHASVVGEEMAMPGGRLAWNQQINQLWDQGQLSFQTLPLVDVDLKPEYHLLLTKLSYESGEPLSALSFMPALSALGRLAELDQAAVAEALRRVASSRRRVGVTLSRAALENPSALQGYFDSTALARTQIVFEIAEADLLATSDRWALLEPMLSRHGNWVLKHAGLANGTIEAVRRFKPRGVKLAPSLIQGAMHRRASAEFVRTTSHLLRSLDCKVWVEGVSDQATWEWVVQHPFDGGQGHFVNTDQ